MADAVTQGQPAAPGQPAPRVVSDEDKAQARDWLKRIEVCTTDRKEDEKRFENNRKWLRGVDPSTGKKLRTNLHFANLAAMRPQVYAKDPEYAVELTKAVSDAETEVWRRFGETAEALLQQKLVRDGKLKKRAKRLMTSTYATSVGWWKVCWQEDRRTDPLIVQQIKDTQDNLELLKVQRDQLAEAAGAADTELKIGQLQQTLAGLQAKAEVSVARGLVIDFVLSEDIVVLDMSVREIQDYERAGAIAHRVWMTRDTYRKRFGYDPTKAKSYREMPASGMTQVSTDSSGKEKNRDLLCVWEIWEQDSNRVFTVCDGEEGFPRQPYSPDWTGERWYPFFLLTFNDVEGYWPLSDIDLTAEVVSEYNRTRDDFERDRKNALPLNVVRKGGALTPKDVETLANRQGGDVVVVEGTMGRPLTDDIWSGQLGTIRPENYDTSQPRTDMEMLVGGGDAARGAVLKAKTATEAEILAQGLRGRSAERTDIIEDLLSDVGKWALEIMLRKMTLQEVQQVAGAEAVWPELRADDVFKFVALSVRGGSTGKPDMLQQQDRWTKLLPVIEQAMGKVAELRMAGQEQAAQAVIELVRETLRRFDERIDIDRFLPPVKNGEEPQQPMDPMQDPRVQQMAQEMQQQFSQVVQQLQDELAKCKQALADKEGDRMVSLEQARINATRDVEVASVRAPIEAQAKVEAARIAADATAAAQVLIAQVKAAAEPAEPVEPGEPPEPMDGEDANETVIDKEQELAPLIAAIQESQSRIEQVVAQALAAAHQPKPLMQVIHEKGPDGLIARSYQAPLQ